MWTVLTGHWPLPCPNYGNVSPGWRKLIPLPWMREAPLTWRFDALPGWLTTPIAKAGRAMVVQSSPFAEELPWTTLAATAWLTGAIFLTAYSVIQLWKDSMGPSKAVRTAKAAA